MDTKVSILSGSIVCQFVRLFGRNTAILSCPIYHALMIIMEINVQFLIHTGN